MSVMILAFATAALLIVILHLRALGLATAEHEELLALAALDETDGRNTAPEGGRSAG